MILNVIAMYLKIYTLNVGWCVSKYETVATALSKAVNDATLFVQ